MRKIVVLALLLSLAVTAGAMEKRDTIEISIDSLMMTDEYLDTVNVKKSFVLNNYSMIGIQYGVGISSMSFSPEKRQSSLFTPRHFGITFTTYSKLFGFMPYFGLEAGVFYGQGGYKFKKDHEGNYTSTVDHAIECTYDYIEVPMMMHLHLDLQNFKLIANAGMYGGYRYKVHRIWEEGYDDPEHTDAFYDYDIKFDYGLKGGLGFGVVFDPVEFHIKGLVRYGFGSIYKPDYHSKDHFRFAKPFDIEICVGACIQLTKRTGKTRGMLRREAYDMVYHPENYENGK